MRGARLLGPGLAAALALGACDAADRTSNATQEAANASQAGPGAGADISNGAEEMSNAAKEVDFPERTGRVVDRAELLGPEAEARLTETLAELERRTTDQLVIVTIPSLGGRSIQDYARELGNHWRVGSGGKSNGVLLVVAPHEQQVRIAVGRGLEPILTNARAAEIIRRDLLPAFRESRWEAGITAGTSSIVRVLTERSTEPARSRP